MDSLKQKSPTKTGVSSAGPPLKGVKSISYCSLQSELVPFFNGSGEE